METPRLPLSLTPPTPELETLVELLVDDELDAAERRALLERLDEIDDGWKYCATAFLEAQTFRRAFRFLAASERAADRLGANASNKTDDAETSTGLDISENPLFLGESNDFADFNASPVAASRRDFPEPRIIPLNASASRGSFRRSFGSDGSGGDGPRRFARFAATTAGFLLSVAFGALLYRQIAPTAPSSPSSASRSFKTDANLAAVETPTAPKTLGAGAASPIRFVTLRSPSRSLDDVAVPCVEGDLDDLAALRATRFDVRDVPPPIVEALRTSGGRVQTVRDELRFPLDDGRTLVLPVDVYEIRSEFAPIY